MEWISVKDRLPDYGERVLVNILWNKKQQFQEVEWLRSVEETGIGTIINWAGEYPHGEITHWMSLPEPPKQDSNN